MTRDVFISYVTPDKEIADEVLVALENQGISCWIAWRDVQPGKSFASEIVDAIRASKVLVLIFSASTNQSRHVPIEVHLAAEFGKVIVPFRINNAQPEKNLIYLLALVQWLDASTPTQRHLDKLTMTIASIVKSASAGPVVADTAQAQEKVEQAKIDLQQLEAEETARLEKERRQQEQAAAREQAEQERQRQEATARLAEQERQRQAAEAQRKRDFDAMVQNARAALAAAHRLRQMLHLQKEMSQADQLVQSQRYAAVCTLLTSAVGMMPDDPSIPSLRNLCRYADLMSRGGMALAKTDAAAAVASYREALTVIPNDVDATQALQHAQSLESIHTARQRFDAAKQQASQFMFARKYAEAVTWYALAIDLMPTDPSAAELRKLAQYAGFMDRAAKDTAIKYHDSAVKSYQDALALFPNDARALQGLRQAKLARFLRKLAPYLGFAVGSIVVESLIVVFWIAGGWPGLFNGIVAIVATLFGWVLGGFAGMLLQEGVTKWLQPADRWLRRKELRERSALPAHVITTAVLLAVLPVLAPILWREARADRYDRLLQQASASLDRQDVAGALASYQSALQIKPNDDRLIYYLYDCYRRLGYANAVDDAYKAINIYPSSYYGMGLRGLALQAQGAYEFGLLDLTTALNMPGANDPDTGMAMLREARNTIWAENDAVKDIQQRDGQITRSSPGGAVILVQWPRSGPNPGKLQVLSKLKFLEALDLFKNVDVVDADLLDLKDLTKLQTLNLDGTYVTDTGLNALRALTSLRELRLGSNFWDTSPGVVNLKKALPGCQIHVP